VFWLFCSSRHTVITVTSAISLLVGASLGGLVLAALGGMLAYRGFSGHCATYQLLGVSTAEGRRPDAERGALGG